MNQPPKPETGGSAFPLADDVAFGCEGMTLRDYFAAAALTAYLAGRNFDDRVTSRDAVATTCYQYADAMLKARAAI